MIKCNACGAENPDTNKFCQNCGIEIVSGELSREITGEVAAIATEIPEIPVDILIVEEKKIEGADLITSATGSDIASEPVIPAISSLDTSESVAVKPAEDITAPELINPTLVNLSYAGLSDVGREREHNEDGFRCFSQTMSTTSHKMPEFETHRGLFILCDGMGGHEGGDVASGLALSAIAESFKPFWTSGLPGREKIKEIITLANQVIFDRNETELRQDLGRMGTTLVLLAIYGTEVAIAHVGDSRIYKITADGFSQITRDHEVAMKLIDQGIDPAIALSRPDAHQLTQALGPNAGFMIEPAIEFLTLNTSTVFLLCSDGLSDNQVVEAHWQQLSPLLEPNPEIKQELQLKAKTMIQLGNDLNGYDNISAVLVKCQIEV